MAFNNSSFNSSSNIWSQPSSSLSWGDMMKKGLLDKPILGTNQAESKPKWDEALGKAAQYLAGTNRDKNTREAQRTPYFFGQEKKDGIGGYQVAPDIAYFPGQSTPGFTIPGEEKKGGWGSTIGGAIGLGGTALGVFGPLGMAGGTLVGGAIDKAFD
ncbi:MAG: hypothetical protein JRE18_08775 [Deltaproteobacteria bacterium]|jgi:hypothetical protein|nr:hypothetical protein [Deltaproteobacteria bacterium]